MSKFAKGANAKDVYHVYGMAVAYATVNLLKRLGKNPTRAGLIAAVDSMNIKDDPFLLPGIIIKTGPATISRSARCTSSSTRRRAGSSSARWFPTRARRRPRCGELGSVDR